MPTAAALADAIEGELDRLGVAQFHVAGYSLGARVALELATRGRTRSVIAIAPDGLGTPLERLHQAAALLSGRTLAMLLAPHRHPSGGHRRRTVAVLRHGAEPTLAGTRRGCPSAAAGLRPGAGLPGDGAGGHVRCPDAA
jgi:pimeloyl-ACP methyl ester carboxylesterase